MHTLVGFAAGAASGLIAVGLWRWLVWSRRLFSASPAQARMLQLREESERALKQIEHSFMLLFDGVEDLVFILDVEGNIQKVNQKAASRLGYGEAELFGRQFLSLVRGSDAATAGALLDDARAGRTGHCRIAALAKETAAITVEVDAAGADWEGKPALFAIARDVADAEASEQKFAKAFHGSPALMALIRLDDMTVVDVNRAFLNVLGYSREEAIGKRPTQLDLFVDMQQRDVLVDALLHGKQAHELEMPLRTRAGQVRDGLLSTETLSLSGESLILAVMVDITERKRVEAALRAVAAELERKNQELAVARDAALDAARTKSQFLAGMSHEIRTPLNGMLGLAELLSRSSLSAEQQEYLDSLTRCGDTLLSTLNDLLDISKLEAGRLQIESIPFDLRPLVYDVVEFYGAKASPAEIEVVVDIDSALPVGFLGDPGRLRQVLGNLVSNAVKFTVKGHILIEATQLRREGASAVLSIAVSDTGEGIPEEAQGRLFQPFTQADASTSRKHGGTGLGLALCKRIVEGMGGSIVLRSVQGQGCTLTITLTLPVEESRSAQPPSLAGIRCLVVDDNVLVREAVERQLRGLGAEAASVASGEEAINAAGASLHDGRPYDLVLIDLYMPGLGGHRLARVLRSDLRLGNTGIVMLAPLALHPAAPDGFLPAAGICDGLLLKTSRPEVLSGVLSSVVENRRSGRAGVLVTRHSLSAPKVTPAQVEAFPFPLRVLLAEDNEVNQLVARKMLEEAGATVTVVWDGNQVVEAVEREPFDLVMMDCQMPGLDGIGATAHIRAAEASKGGHLPILAVTASSMAEDQARCLAAGMDGYLAKPFRREDLRREIVRIIRSARSAAKTTQAAVGPNLDRARFKDMAQLLGAASSDGHAMLLRSFQRNTEKRVEELSHAIEGRDAESAYGVAHAIKGSSSNLGFVGLEQLAGQIERLAREGRLETLSGEMQAMQEELGRVRLFLDDYFRETALQG